MPSVGMQSAAGSRRKKINLWSDAPGWRNLTLTAVVLTVSALTLPRLLPESQDEAIAPPRSQPIAATPVPEIPKVPVPAASPSPAISVPEAPPVPAPTAAPARVPLKHDIQPTTPVAPRPLPSTTSSATAGESKVCNITADVGPKFNSGVVVSFWDHDTAMRAIQVTQRNRNAAIDPAYVQNQRVLVRTDSGRETGVLIPRKLVVRVGDRVMFRGNHRNFDLPCNYIPNLITSDLGPDTQTTTPSGVDGR